jgi:dienelactone hydrolase
LFMFFSTSKRSIAFAALGVLALSNAFLLRAGPERAMPEIQPERLNPTNLLVFRKGINIQPVRSVADWQIRRREIIAGAEAVMGTLPPRSRHPLSPRILGEEDRGSYVAMSVTFAAADPGGRVPAYLLVPKAALLKGARLPAVLALHQTHPLGNKVVVGLGNSPNDEYGVELAERGYVVLAPSYPRLAGYHPEIEKAGYASGTMKAISDNRRALDYLESLPWVRPGRFAAIGHSLGGHNSIYTAVFDSRIQVVVTSCGFDSFADYMDGNIQGWTSDRYMPRLRQYSLAEIPFDFPELLGALAPRAVFISAPVGDTNFKWQSVARSVQAARPVFALHGAAGNLRVEHPECGHLFPADMREVAYRIIDATLRP